MNDEAASDLVLMTHLGRPGGQRDEKLELGHVAYRLQELLSGTPVEIAGSDWKPKADKLKPGQSLLLENLRFDSGEKRGDEAFATCHRKHVSMFAVPKLCSPYPKASLSPTPPGTASPRTPQPS